MLTRRQVLSHGAAAASVLLMAEAGPVATASRAQEPTPLAPSEPYRAAVIGHTGRGNYGHGLDVVWLKVPEAQIVAVADADAPGLTKAVERLKASRGYADYREMLQQERPRFVSVAPRFVDEHRDMVLACAEAGVRGIYCEKPLARTLAEADEIVAACEKHGVKLCQSFQTRFCPRVAMAKRLIDEGRIGRVLEIRGRGKEDRRGGGEDLWVLGSHLLNLMNYLAGQPLTCSAAVLKEGKSVTRQDVIDGAEGLGPLAGDEVHATYRFASGVTGYFDSIKDGQLSKSERYGLIVLGTKGAIRIPNGYQGAVLISEDPSWPVRDVSWAPIGADGVGKAEPVLPGGGHPEGNLAAVRELIAAVEAGSPLRADVLEGRTVIEMIAAVFESHRQGKPVEIPLKNRDNPLTML